MALGLPIKIVVLTIVGMVGLAAMISIIDNSQAVIPKPMHANLNSGSLTILSNFSDTDSITVPIEVVNSKDGTPVEKASVALSGLNAFSVNITDREGSTVLNFNKNDFNLDTNEGYLRLNVKATGFLDYTNEYAVKIVK